MTKTMIMNMTERQGPKGPKRTKDYNDDYDYDYEYDRKTRTKRTKTDKRL
jgi:hypothetical protein